MKFYNTIFFRSKDRAFIKFSHRKFLLLLDLWIFRKRRAKMIIIIISNVFVLVLNFKKLLHTHCILIFLLKIEIIQETKYHCTQWASRCKYRERKLGKGRKYSDLLKVFAWFFVLKISARSSNCSWQEE